MQTKLTERVLHNVRIAILAHYLDAKLNLSQKLL